MCDKIIKYLNYYGKYLHLYLITVLTKVIAIVFVFENFVVFVIVFKYYAMYLDPSLVWTIGLRPLNSKLVADVYAGLCALNGIYFSPLILFCLPLYFKSSCVNNECRTKYVTPRPAPC